MRCPFIRHPGESRGPCQSWIPAFAGMTEILEMDQRWVPAFAGMTEV